MTTNSPSAARTLRRKETLPWWVALAASIVALLAAGAPAAAQLDPQDLADTAAFLSFEQFNGRPTLVSTPAALPMALGQLGAVLVGEDLYDSAQLGSLTFEIFRHPNPPSLLSVLCEDPERFEDPCPDIVSITYKDRGCYQDAGISYTQFCDPVGDGTFVKAWDPVKNRCRLQSPGNFCTEIRVIGWHYQYFADSCCQLEIPGSHAEHTALRCSLCN